MKYSIGDYVIVSSKMVRRKYRSVFWIPLKLAKPQLGQVIGLATRYDGDIERSGNYEELAYFTPTNTHVFWQVKFGLLNKPILVRADGMRLATLDEFEELPKLYTRTYWSDKMKQVMSEDSKHWPRDPKGRWLKC